MPRRKSDSHKFTAHSRIHIVGLIFATIAACSNPEQSNVTTLDAREGSAKKTFETSDSNQEFLLFPFSTTSTPGSLSEAYSIQLDLELFETTTSLSKKTSLDLNPTQRLLKKRIAHETQRAKSQLPILQAAYQNRFQSYAPVSTRTLSTITDTITISSPFDGDLNQNITGILRGQALGVALYIDSRDNAMVSDTQAHGILSAYAEISLPRLKALFGDPTDIDENEVVVVFLTGTDQIGTTELGFFRAMDLLPSGSTTEQNSNEGEIIYARIPDEEVPLELVHATLAHETFHLLNFGIKSLPLFEQSAGLALIIEETFLNEGLAHLAEDLAGWGICTPLIAEIYLQCIQHTSLAGSGSATVEDRSYCETVTSEGDGLPRRGGMMLLLMRLFQQAGGATYSEATVDDISGPGIAFLRELHATPLTGIANLSAATGRSFFAMYSDFMATLALDNNGAKKDSQFQMAPEVADSFTNLIRNVRVRSNRIDLITNADIVLDGPTFSDSFDVTSGVNVTGSIYPSGADVFHLSVPANTSMTLTVEAPENLALGLSIVQIP